MIHVAIMFYIVCSRPIFCGFCCVQCPVKSSYSHNTIAFALKTILKRWTFFINKEYNGNWYNGDLSGDFKCIFDVFEPINVLSKRPPLFRLAIKLLTLNIGSDSVILSLHRIRIGPINFRRVFYGIYYIGLLHLFFLSWFFRMKLTIIILPMAHESIRIAAFEYFVGLTRCFSRALYVIVINVWPNCVCKCGLHANLFCE